MRLAVLYSGGKDSNFALHIAKRYHEVICLINMKSKNENSYMFQSAGNEIVNLQSEALELPLIKFETKGEKEKELEDLKNAILIAKEKYGIEGVVTGAINSVYQASRVQKICLQLGLWCFNPLWQIKEDKFIKSLIKENFKIILVAIAAYPLTKKNIGEKIDKNFISFISSIKTPISLIGEGGEFESLVLDSPDFKKRIEIMKSEIVMDSENSGILRLENVRLVNK